MFGFRPEGRALLKGIDPFTGMLPYIMTTRTDAMCYCTQYADSDVIQKYLRKKRLEGHNVSVMSLMIAAYVRTISQFPEINRFVVGKKVYARKELCISFVVVKIRKKDDFLDTTVKLYFDPRDTLFEVAEKVEKAIEDNRKVDNENSAEKVIQILRSIPGLVTVGVAILKGLDKVGWMPRAIVDASPFHSSLFFTNMGSINLNSIYHHIYNFGTVSVFIALGKREDKIKVDRKGNIGYQRVFPMGVVTDERVAAGAIFALAFDYLDRLLHNPEMLETPPETVRFDYKAEYRNRRDKDGKLKKKQKKS